MNGQSMWPSDLVGDGLCSCAPGNSCIYTVLYFLSKSRVWIASNYPRLNPPKVKHDRLKRTPSNGNTVWKKTHYEKQKTTDMIHLTEMTQGMLGMLCFSNFMASTVWNLQDSKPCPSDKQTCLAMAGISRKHIQKPSLNKNHWKVTPLLVIYCTSFLSIMFFPIF